MSISILGLSGSLRAGSLNTALLRAAGYFTGYLGKNHTPVGANGYDSGVINGTQEGLGWLGSSSV